MTAKTLKGPNKKGSPRRVIQTFMFTDVVKSTDIREACIRKYGDKGNKICDEKVLEPHDNILNRLVAKFEGRVISTGGDSYFCSFDFTRDAIQCAVDIQRQFISEKIPLPVDGDNLPPCVQVRIGLHRGGASEVLRAGRPNLSDHTLNIASRIQGWAKGEQVLMSEETWNSAGMLDGIARHDWKGYRLKGVGGQWTLVEAIWDERQPVPLDISIGDLLFETFAGRVESISEEMLSHPANSRRIQQFYAGAKLDWDIIAAHGDIPRGQQDDLIQNVEEPYEGMRLFGVVAEAGAGKSTLAWRVAAELHKEPNALVLHVKDSEDADVWYRMPEFFAKINRPFYVLVDDIFREQEAARAFIDLEPWLPIKVIATSRPNEFRSNRLKCEMLRIDLRPPSFDEKKCILDKIGKNRADLTAEQLRRLDSANQFLVLMMELTEGKELKEIVRDTIEKLKELDEPAYHAYEYLCFTFEHGQAIPVSLLERLDSQGRFHNLLERETTQGLVFSGPKEAFLRAGHPVIARTAAAFYAKHHSPQAVLNEIASAVDIECNQEKYFFAHLLKALAQADISLLASMPESLKSLITYHVENANRIAILNAWRGFYLLRGQGEEADKCLGLALTLEPISGQDCIALQKLSRECGKEEDALPVITKWIQNNPKDHIARGPYLLLLERVGAPKQVEQVVQETRDWLVSHSEGTFVRFVFIGLVERKGTPKQVEQAIQETKDWLVLHSEGASVRTAYIGLVERRGTPMQVEQVIDRTGEWLVSHSDDVYVRPAFIGLVERSGTPTQVEQLVKDTSDWLAEPAHLNVHVREAWLNFVEMRGSDDLKKSVIDDLKAWLAKNPSAKEVWTVLIACLARSGKSAEANELALKAISLHPDDANLLDHYLRAVQNIADEPTIQGLYEELIIKSGDKTVIPSANYAKWLGDHGYHEESEKRYRGIIAKAPRNYAPKYGYAMLLLKLDRFNEAASQFREVLKIHKGHAMAHDGLARALWKLGDFGQAEQGFRQAIYWSGISGQLSGRFFTSLGSFYADLGQWPESLQAFETAQYEAPDYFGNYWGIGKALMGMGKYAEAAVALRTSLDKAPPELELPASEEIPELLRQCMDHVRENDPS